MHKHNLQPPYCGLSHRVYPAGMSFISMMLSCSRYTVLVHTHTSTTARGVIITEGWAMPCRSTTPGKSNFTNLQINSFCCHMA